MKCNFPILITDSGGLAHSIWSCVVFRKSVPSSGQLALRHIRSHRLDGRFLWKNSSAMCLGQLSCIELTGGCTIILRASRHSAR